LYWNPEWALSEASGNLIFIFIGHFVEAVIQRKMTDIWLQVVAPT